MIEQANSTAEQDYLKAIYRLQEETGRATTQALATRLGVRAASVTAMIKRLADDEGGPYVTHTPYRGVELTERGREVALEMLRHHRLIENFLAQFLDVPWDQVHAEAERLEHVISEDLEERIAAKLGQPTHDLHGDPIPRRDGTVANPTGVPLSALTAGDCGTIERVPDGEPALLRYLATLGLVPNATVAMEAVAPYGDVYTVRIGPAVHAIGGDIARRILIRHIATSPAGAMSDISVDQGQAIGQTQQEAGTGEVVETAEWPNAPWEGQST